MLIIQITRHDHHDRDTELEEEEGNDGCRHDDDQSIASDPGQPLAVNLPVNILETVFAHLSVQDMMNCSLVCARWSSICMREKVSESLMLVVV